MSERPDWVTCVRDNHVDNAGKAWCGRPVAGFVFEDIDHAAMNGRKGGRLTCCPACLRAITAGLSQGVEG